MPRLLVAVLAAAALAAPASAGAHIVNTAADRPADAARCPGADCSLRDALAQAAATPYADEIELMPARIVLTEGALTVPANTTIRPLGGFAPMTTIVGDGTTRVLDATAPVQLDRLEITGGDAAEGAGLRIGGAGPVVLEGLRLHGNTASGTDARGGGLLADVAGDLRLDRVTIDDNRADGTASAAGSGAWLRASGRLHVRRTTVSGNVMSGPAGSEGALSLRGTSPGAPVLQQVTVAANRGTGGGVGAALPAGARFELTILADDDGDDCGRVGGEPIAADGDLLAEEPGDCLASGSTARTGADPRLGPLTPAGGPLPVHRPQTGSPAIDAGAAPSCGDGGDQRSQARDGLCDLGAVEVRGPSLTPDPLDFGRHPRADGPLVRTATFVNDGEVAVTAQRADAVTGGWPNDPYAPKPDPLAAWPATRDYAIVRDGCAGRTVAVGERCTVDVAYDPVDDPAPPEDWSRYTDRSAAALVRVFHDGPGRADATTATGIGAGLPLPPMTIDDRTPVSSHGDWVATSMRERGSGRYRLMIRSGRGPFTPAAVPPRHAPFDVDLGPDARGRTTAVYSRCAGEAIRCDIFRLDLRTGRETRDRAVSSRSADELLPAIWWGRMTFARRTADGKRTHVHLRHRGRTRRVPVGIATGGPTGADLRGRRLALTWYAELPARAASGVRIVDLDKRRARLVTPRYRSTGVHGSPSLTDAAAYWVEKPEGSSAGRIARLALGRRGRVTRWTEPALHAAVRVRDRFVRITGPWRCEETPEGCVVR